MRDAVAVAGLPVSRPRHLVTATCRLSLSFVLVVLGPALPTAQEPLIVRGRVVAADGGAPIAGARVGLSQEHSVRTDGSGRFVIAIPPGSRSTLTLPQGQRAPQTLASLTVTKAGFVSALLSVEKNVREPVARLTRGGAITVHVFDASGEPVRTSVRISGVPSAGVRNPGGPSASTASDDRGQFRMGNLRAGRYTVSVGGASAVSVRLPPRELSDDEIIRLRQEMNRRSKQIVSEAATRSSFTVDLTPGQEVNVYLVDVSPRSASPSIDISGAPRKGDASVQGRVMFTDGLPVAGATVTVAIDLGPTLARTVTDITGTFAIGGLPAGALRVRASKAGLTSAERAGDIMALGTSVSLEAGEHRRDLVLSLADTGEILGTVLDEYGGPVERAVVVLIKVTDAPGAAAAAEPSRAVSDDRGRYRVPMVPTGTYYVLTLGEMLHLGDAYVYAPGTVSEQDARPVTVRPGEQVTGIDFRLNPTLGHQITGTVLDSNGRPRPGTGVNLRGLDTRGVPVRYVRTAVADAFGDFTFLNVVPGQFVLSAQLSPAPALGLLPQVVNGEVVRPSPAAGRETGSARVKIPADAAEPLIIRMAPAGNNPSAVTPVNP